MANITKRKSRGVDIRLAHSLADVISGAKEATQRVLLAAACKVRNGDVGEDRGVKLRMADIVSTSGGVRTSIYRSAKNVVKEMRSMNYYIADDGKSAFVNEAVIEGTASLKDGFFQFTFTSRAIAEIADVEAAFTLLHLKNVKRCSGGAMVTLYMLLARWDSRGEVHLVPSDFPGKTATREPVKMQTRVFDPFVAKFNALGAKIGLNMKYTATGRGKDHDWHFTWLPRALHKLGDIPDDGELPIKGGYSAAAVNAMRIDMYLRRHGVFDKAIPRLLAQLPSEVATDIVKRSCDEAPHKPGVINKLIKGEIFEYLDGNTAEQIAARRMEAEKIKDAIVVEAQSEAAEEMGKVMDWLAGADDKELLAAAMELKDSEWDLIAKMKRPKNMEEALPVIRERAGGNEWLASALAAKAGVVEAE